MSKKPFPMPDNSLCNKVWIVWKKVRCTLSLGHESGHYHKSKGLEVWWIGDKELERQLEKDLDRVSR